MLRVKMNSYMEIPISGDNRFEYVIVCKTTGKIYAAFVYKPDAQKFISQNSLNNFEVREIYYDN